MAIMVKSLLGNMFQYIICCWFNQKLQGNQKITIVSIHYMLLVQFSLSISSVANLKFQYIICCWFNLLKALLLYRTHLFQYIICCWFNNLHNLHNRIHHLFQYIICCWFNNFSTQNWSICWYVSIHYMLLVQIIPLGTTS